MCPQFTGLILDFTFMVIVSNMHCSGSFSGILFTTLITCDKIDTVFALTGESVSYLICEPCVIALKAPSLLQSRAQLATSPPTTMWVSVTSIWATFQVTEIPIWKLFQTR